MKKEMFKKVKAVLLSVFILGIALIQSFESVEVQASVNQSAILAEIKDKTGLKISESDVYFYYRISDVYYCIRGFENETYSNNFDVTVRVFLSQPNNNNLCYLNFALYADIDTDDQIAFGYERGLSSDSTNPVGNIGMRSIYYKTELGKCAVVETFRIPLSSINDIEVLSTNVESYKLPVNQDGVFSDGKFIKTGYSGTLKNNIYDSSKDENGGSSGTYDNELGYLQNIKYTGLKTGNSVNTGDSDYRFKVSYSLKTSTGVSLKDEGVGVQWLVKLKGGYETLMGQYNSLPTVNSSYYHIMDKSNHFYIDSGLYNDLVKEFRTSDVPFTASLKYTTYIYCRPYRFSSSGNTYGLWSRIDNKGGVTTINNGTTSTGDVSKEADGEDDDFISESTNTNKPEFGSGTDWDDAESNAGPTDSLGTVINNNFNFGDVLSIFNSFKSGLGEFIKAMGDFPQLIAKTFPFLPTFITSAIGLGFLMAVVLRLLGR